jgi:acetyl-CoA carboxylase biotin carboxyl carrier protein
MDVAQIAELMEKFDQSGSASLELKTADFSLKLKKEEACRTDGHQGAPQMAPPVPMMPYAQQMPGMMPYAMPQAPGMAPQADGAEAPQNAQDTDSAAAAEDYIKAPLVGVFYAAPSPEKEPFVSVGQRVKKGETVCMVEAMKMMSEVTAPKDGTITKILVENGDFIEFDQPLFTIQE